MKPKVSIVVPVYNGEKILSLCLNSLINLDFPHDEMEIIVVDNNSSDATKEIIWRYPVKHIFEGKKGRGAARNKGVKESKGELVAFIDADCVAERKWLTNIIKGFMDESIGGCGGEVFPHKPQTLIAKYYDFMGLFSQKNGLITMNLPLPRIATLNSVYRREVLEEVGLFDESFIANEDVDLSWRVYLKGYQLKYVPEAIVYHQYSDNLIDFFKKWFERGYAHTYLLQKYSNLIKWPLVRYSDWVGLFCRMNKANIFFFLILNSVAFFLGNLYGSVRVRLGMERISSQPIPENKMLWRMADEKVLISKPERDFNYVLNDVGSKVWTLYMEGKDVSKIIDIITDEYNVDKEQVKNDIIGFIEELKNESLVAAEEQ